MRRGVMLMVQCSHDTELNPRSGTVTPSFRPQAWPGAAPGSATSAAAIASFFVIPIYRSPSRWIPCGLPEVSRTPAMDPSLAARSAFARRARVAALRDGGVGDGIIPISRFACSEPDDALLRRGVGAGGGGLLRARAVERREDAGGDGVVGAHPHHLVGGGAEHGLGD